MDEISAKKVSWEASKENVQPIRQGRNVSCLNAALQPSQQDMQYLLQERQKFEEEILADGNATDPIDPWDRYLRWTRQHFPIGENSRKYEIILEKYINKFLKHVQYKNDPRYVDAWLTMAEINENPANIFAYMRSEGIGTSCASFYVAWADEYEKYNHFQRASAVYQLGEKNDAQPVEILAKMKSAFEMRTARASVSGIQNSQDDSSVMDESETGEERKALRNLQGVGQKKIVKSVRIPDDKSSSRSSSRRQVNSSTTSRKKISCYSEGDNEQPLINDSAKWTKMPNSTSLNKENNLQNPSKWNTTKVHQRRGHTGSKSSGFTIFEEALEKRPETKSQTKEKSKTHPNHHSEHHARELTASTSAGFTIFQEATPVETTAGFIPSSARKVSRNVENFLSERKHKSYEESTLHKTIRESYGDTKANMVFMYPVEKVYSVMGEFQHEEIFAAQWRRKLREKKEEEERLQKEKKARQEYEEFKRREEEMKNQLKAAQEQLMKKENQLGRVVGLLSNKLGENEESSSLSQVQGEMTMKVENLCGQLNKLRSAQQSDENSAPSRDYGEMTMKVEKLCSQLYQLNEDSQGKTREASFSSNRATEQENFQEFPSTTALDRSSVCKDTSTPSLCNRSKLTLPSPTVCTKEALGNIMDMFQQPLPQETSAFADVTHEELSAQPVKFQMFCDDSLSAPPSADATKPHRSITVENRCYQENVDHKRNQENNLVTTTATVKKEESVSKTPFAVVSERSILEREPQPTFLGDLSIARGFNGDFAAHQLSSSGFFCPNQDESLHGSFVRNERMLAESTSCWPAGNPNKMKTPDNLADSSQFEGDCAEDENCQGQAKKLSPILEASEETDKSTFAKSHQAFESLPSQKSFIRPPTVNRKRIANVSAVTYKEESSIDQHGTANDHKDLQAPKFSIFSDNTEPIVHTSMSNISSFRQPCDISDMQIPEPQPIGVDPVKNSFSIFADKSVNRTANSELDLLSSLHVPNSSLMNKLEEPQAKIASSKPSHFSIFEDETMDCDANAQLSISNLQLPSESIAKLSEIDNLDDLCSELMETSLSEFHLDKTDVNVLPPLPNQSISNNESFRKAAPSAFAVSSSADANVEMDASFAKLPDHVGSEVSMSMRSSVMESSLRENASSSLKVVRDPWADQTLLEIMETGERIPNMFKISGKMPPFRSGRTFTMGEESCTLLDVIGEGAFAKVHLAEDLNKKLYAIKVQTPSFPWEVYILNVTKKRLRQHVNDFKEDVLMDVRCAIAYDDASCIVCDYIPYGTLLDYIKHMQSANKAMPYFDIALAILKVIDWLHSVDIIHGDIKPDNFMVCSDYKSNTSPPQLRLIDFGRAIDMRAFSKKTAFTRSCGTSGFVCAQMKLKQPWSYHTDYYGIAGTLYVLLTKKYMSTVQDTNGVWKTTNRIPRWTGSCWAELFTRLLNFPTPSDGWCPTYKDSPLPSIIKSMVDNKDFW